MYVKNFENLGMPLIMMHNHTICISTIFHEFNILHNIIVAIFQLYFNFVWYLTVFLDELNWILKLTKSFACGLEYQFKHVH